MTPNLAPGKYNIVSLHSGDPAAGVNKTLPAWQNVYLNGPVTTWVVKEVDEINYLLSIGGYSFTGVMDDKVVASIDIQHAVEWRILYQVAQDAYTIEPANDPRRGWTVPFDADPNSDAVIELMPIIMLPSEPPRFSTAQLFKFVPIDE